MLRLLAIGCLLLMLSAAIGAVRAADVTARAIISPATTQVGEPVQLQIEVENARGRIMGPDVSVDGLDVNYRGSSQSQQTQLGTGGFSSVSKLSLNYEVLPKREGDFTIPALTVVVDGKTLQTKPVGLKVQKGASGQPRADSNPAKASAEIELKKKNVYVGEAVPIEVKLLIDERVRVGEVGGFELVGEGFTAQKFPKFDQQRETRDGRTYLGVIFRTVLTPSKAGKITVGPCEIPFLAQMPRERKTRRRGVFDSFFDDDFFGGLGAFAETQRYNAQAPAVEINVKPLPAEGRPKDFSGAVGQFQFDAESPTARVKTGEPLNMRLRVSGEGNFDRVQAPALVDKAGWQAYDASEKFDPANELKNSGTKSFEMPVVPQAAHNQTPQFAFSFFDPVAEKYVTQKSKPTPLVVEGAPVAPTAPTPSLATIAATPRPVAQAAAETKPSSVTVPLQYELGERRDFTPLHRRPVFWMWNGAAAVGAFGLVGLRLLQRDPQQKRAAALRREREQLLRGLRSDRRPDEFFDRAARVLQLATALKTGVDSSCVDAAAAKSALAREDEVANQIEEIFDRRGALIYAGGGGGTELTRSERERILAVLEELCGK